MAYLRSGASLARTRELEIQGDIATAGKLLLSTSEPTVVSSNELGRIDFQAPVEASGTDAILVGASIFAEAEDTFATNKNSTGLVFSTGDSETATEQMRITRDGNVGINTATPSYLLDVQGTVGITGASTHIGAITVGVDNTGHDVKFFGATASAYMLWDESADDLILAGSAALSIDATTDSSSTTTGSFHTDGGVGIAKKLYVAGDIYFTGTLNQGVDGTGQDAYFYGDTSAKYMHWDQSEDAVRFQDNTQIRLGNATAGDMVLYHDGTNSIIDNKTGNLLIGNQNSGIAVKIGHATSETTIGDNLTVTGTTALTGVVSAATHVDMVDGGQLRIGTGEDIQIFHDGTHSYIHNKTGALKIATATSGIAVLIGHTTSETTIADNATITGTLTQTGIATFAAIPVFSAGINVSGGTIAGTLSTAAQGSVTSLGTLTGLTVNGAAVFNENSADVDFRVESNGNANMLFVDAGNDRVGIGTSSPNHELDVRGEIYCEGDVGLTMLDTGTSPYVTWTAQSVRSGSLSVQDNEDLLIIRAKGYAGNAYRAFAEMIFAADATVAITDCPGRIEFWTTPDGAYVPLQRMTIKNTGKVGIGDTDPEATLTVQTADSGVSVSSGADELMIENSASCGMTIGAGTGSVASIFFADSGSNSIGRIEYDHAQNDMVLYTNSAEQVTITSAGLVKLLNATEGGDYVGIWLVGNGWVNGPTLNTLDSGYMYYGEAYVNGYYGSNIYHTACLFNPGVVHTQALVQLTSSTMTMRMSSGILQFQEVSSGGTPQFGGHVRKAFKI